MTMVLGEQKHVMLSLFWQGMKNTPKSKVLGDLFSRLSFILMQSNARAILARSGLVLDCEADPACSEF